MIFYNILRWCSSVIVLLSLFYLNDVTTANDRKPILEIPRVQAPPAIENFLQMKPNGEIENQMTKVEGFIQQRPKDGEPSEYRTEVYLCHDDKNLYAVFVAFDEPEKVRGHLSRRENIFKDDIVEIMLDTFHDQRRAYAFVINPLGIQWDALWTEGSGFDDSFDTLWHSKGKLTDQGYVVWIAIPFKSLRFPSTPEQTWGVILLREIRRGTSEQSFWPRVSSRIEGRLNQAATLQIKSPISSGRNIQLIPYATYRTFRVLDRQAGEPQFLTDKADPDAGLDAKFVIEDKFAVDLTANPDFSQVESDQPQVTVNQRFEVFFPEKRPFFLENANYFQTPITLVFTRRIADPQFGARVTGKTGAYAVGAMLIDDESPGKRVSESSPLHDKRAAFGILRINRDIFKQSSLGLTYTDREFQDSYNRVAGIDSRIKLNQNWIASLQGVISSTKEQTGQSFTGMAYDLQLNRSGRQLSTHSHYLEFTPDFRTQTGFVPRTDIRDAHQFVSYFFRPEKQFLIRWGPEFLVQRIWDSHGARLDEYLEASLEWEFTGETHFEVNYLRARELLRPQDFPALSENKDFNRDTWDIEYETNILDEFSLEGNFGWGNAINFVPILGQEPEPADMIESEIELSLQPINPLRIDNTHIFFQLNQPTTGNKIFTNQILRSRWNWQLNRKLSLRLIFQYDVTTVNPERTFLNSEKNFNIDFLITYLVNPWTALYVGMNSNYQNLDLIQSEGRNRVVRTQNDFLNDSRQFFVKYSYLFRF